jgi:hypothetical protein
MAPPNTTLPPNTFVGVQPYRSAMMHLPMGAPQYSNRTVIGRHQPQQQQLQQPVLYPGRVVQQVCQGVLRRVGLALKGST